MTNLIPHISFPGNTREALTYYHEILGGEVGFSTYGEFGAAPEGHEAHDKVMHAQLINDTVRIMAADHVEGFGPGVTFGDSIQLSLVGPEEAKLTEAFNRLADGGKIVMPLEKQVWGDIYGACVDKFGIYWMVNIETGESPAAQGE